MTLEVEVNDVSLKYRRVEALKHVSFQLEGGKIYGLLGRNGAGKTSLLSLLASFREPTEGSIRSDIEHPFENTHVMQNVSFIYQMDYSDETEKVNSMLKFVERYRPHFDRDYALHLAMRFNLPSDKAVNKLSKG